MSYWLIIIPSIILLIIYNKLNIRSNNKINKDKTGKEWYKEYLKTNHWQRVRKKALKRAGYKCQVCGYKQNLEVHHNTYKNIWCEKPEDVVVLCWKCHKTFHHR